MPPSPASRARGPAWGGPSPRGAEAPHGPEEGGSALGFLVRVLINAFAIYLVAHVVPGIEVGSVLTALGAGLVLGLINAIVRPILVVLTLPVTLVTLGLFLFVLNGLCLWLTSQLVRGFEVHGFWAAVFGAALVSVVSWVLNAFVSDRGRIVVITRKGG